MSYESKVFKELSLPSKEKVIPILLTSLLKHKGRVKEFGTGDQEFTNELADLFNLSSKQRSFQMKTIVRKEGRLKTFPAWNRLLYRAADFAAKQRLLARPNETLKLTGNREWMLTEQGIDAALNIAKVPIVQKQDLPVITIEVQKLINQMEKAERVKNYNHVDTSKKSIMITTKSLLRNRGFRQFVLQSYDYHCCICGLKIASPDSLTWEVEAAHIVPNRFYGKDDIWNGIALCRFHHWSFDVGWFTLRNDYTIEINDEIWKIPSDQGLMGSFDILRQGLIKDQSIRLPKRKAIFPHENSITWHRQNIFRQLS